MKSFNGDKELKNKLLAEVIKHREADKIVQRTYGDGHGKNWKGCAVGCAIHSLNIVKNKNFETSNHSVYETELGIPRILARLEDRIFEGLSVEESKTFPEKFISAIPVGVDLEMVWPKFVVWLLGDKKNGVKKFSKSKRTIKAIQGVLDLYIRKVEGGTVTVIEWQDARTDAYAAAAADADAAYAYAYAAAAAAYAADADAAAAAAAYAAAADAYAYAAAAAADAYAYAYAARKLAREKHYSLMAEKLIEIISNEK